MKREFSEGDIVHFQAYIGRKPIRARVKKVTFDTFMSKSKYLFYHLSGVDKPLVAVCRSYSIVESRYHRPVKA